MFCSRKLKLRLENIHKRRLRVVYNEYDKNYKDLFADDYEISIHQKYLQLLATEVFKSANKLIHSSCGVFSRTMRFLTI